MLYANRLALIRVYSVGILGVIQCTEFYCFFLSSGVLIRCRTGEWVGVDFLALLAGCVCGEREAELVEKT